MSEIKALVLRRTVGNVADLTSGALALNNFQWGLAKNDDLLVAKDDSGVYHYFYGSSAIDQKIADQMYAREPVANIGALPSTDPDGAIRLVENIETVYVKSNGSWISTNSATADYLKLKETYIPTGLEPVGSIYWDSANSCFTAVCENGYKNQLGEELVTPYQNDTGSTILDGYVISQAGPIGNSGNKRGKLCNLSIDKAVNVLGISTQTILNGQHGKATTEGKIRGIPTNGARFGETWVDGDDLYVHPTSAGYLTKVKPQYPNEVVRIAKVISAHATNGTIEVFIVYPSDISSIKHFHGIEFDRATLAYTTTLTQVGLTLTLAPVGSSFNVWVMGKKYTFTTAQSVTIEDVTQKNFIYFNASGVLTVSQTAWEVRNVSTVSIWPHTVGGFSKAMDERHHHDRDPEWHMSQHWLTGTYMKTPVTIAGYVPNGTIDADNSYSLSSNTVVDEDISLPTTAKTEAGTIPVIYKNGVDAFYVDATNLYGFGYGTYIKKQVNSTGGGVADVAPATLGSYINYYLVGATFLDGTYRQFACAGYGQWDKPNASNTTALASAQSAAVKTDCPVFVGLQEQELVPYAKITYFVRSTLTTTGKCNIASVAYLSGSRQSLAGAVPTGVVSVNGLTGAVTLTQDEIPEGATYGRLTTTQVTDLTDAGDSTLHYHASDRNRENHTGTQTASTISDFASTVRGVVLTGLSLATGGVISIADSILGSLGKLQNQLTSLTTTVNGKASVLHSSSSTVYGVGSPTEYGHVKLYTGTGTSTDGAMDRNSITVALGTKSDNKTFVFTRGAITGEGWANLISITLPNSATTTCAWVFNVIQSGAGISTDQRVGLLKIMWRNGSISGSEFVSFTGSSTIEFGYTGTLALNSAFNVYCYNSSYPYLKFETLVDYGGTIEGGTFSATNPTMTNFAKSELRGEIYNDARYLRLSGQAAQVVAGQINADVMVAPVMSTDNFDCDRLKFNGNNVTTTQTKDVTGLSHLILSNGVACTLSGGVGSQVIVVSCPTSAASSIVKWKEYSSGASLSAPISACLAKMFVCHSAGYFTTL